VWPKGVEPSSRAWRARILAVERRPRRRPGGTLTPVSRFAAARLDPRPPGDGCQGGDRTPAFRVTAGCLAARLPGIVSTATGSRTPLSGLRARCRDLWTIAACSGSGATRTPKGLATPTCFRDRLLIRPGRFQGQKGYVHPHGHLTRTCVAGGLLIWPDPFQRRSPRWGSHPRSRPYQGRALAC
jgi:hypothetical protein